MKILEAIKKVFDKILEVLGTIALGGVLIAAMGDKKKK